MSKQKIVASAVVALIALVDFATLVGPGMLLNFVLTYWANHVMKADTSAAIYGLIAFFLGVVSVALWFPYWEKLWMKRLTEGPRRRALGVLSGNDKD